jgi:hypothetical protein
VSAHLCIFGRKRQYLFYFYFYFLFVLFLFLFHVSLKAETADKSLTLGCALETQTHRHTDTHTHRHTQVRNPQTHSDTGQKLQNKIIATRSQDLAPKNNTAGVLPLGIPDPMGPFRAENFHAINWSSESETGTFFCARYLPQFRVFYKC